MNSKLEGLLELELAKDKGSDWEIVIRFIGDFKDILDNYETYGYELLGGFAVLYTNTDTIKLLAENDNVLYIEKPKRLFFTLEEEKADICLNTGVDNSLFELSGAGVLVAIIDTGLEIADRAFCNADGTTRIEYMWDQTADSQLGYDTEYGYGKEYDSLMINSALEDGRIITTDYAQHGTRVAYIACGNEGVAYRSNILAVKLETENNNRFSFTTKLMAAVDYAVKKSIKLNMPLVINISLGTNYGSHRGDTILEQYLDTVSSYGRNVICVGAGNEGASAIHKTVLLENNGEYRVELAIAPFEREIFWQAWGEAWDDYDIYIITPDGRQLGPVSIAGEAYSFENDSTRILCLREGAAPGSIVQEFYCELIPKADFIQSGIWNILIKANRIKAGRIDMWLQDSATLNKNTGWTAPDSELTITIPATARSVIAVGAYNSKNDAYALFSGRGMDNAVEGDYFWGYCKPDISAPGVNVAVREGTYVTGTSFAVAFVTGACALLMEQGIVRGNDRNMYGQRIKAELVKKAEGLSGQKAPDDKNGWGKVCINS